MLTIKSRKMIERVAILLAVRECRSNGTICCTLEPSFPIFNRCVVRIAVEFRYSETAIKRLQLYVREINVIIGVVEMQNHKSVLVAHGTGDICNKTLGMEKDQKRYICDNV